MFNSENVPIVENGFQVANSNHTELSAVCQGWLLRSQEGHEGPSEALMVAIQVEKIEDFFVDLMVAIQVEKFEDIFVGRYFLRSFML